MSEVKLKPGGAIKGDAVITDISSCGEQLDYIWVGTETMCFGTVSDIREIKKLSAACDRVLKAKGKSPEASTK